MLKLSEVFRGQRLECIERLAGLLLLGVLVLAGAWPAPALGAPAGQESATASATAAAPARPVPRSRRVGAGVDDQVRYLAKVLDLNAQQQVALRKVQQTQLEELGKASVDMAGPPADYLKAVEAINKRAVDQILVLLNDDQKKKFNPPQPQRDVADAAERTDGQHSMNPVEPK